MRAITVFYCDQFGGKHVCTFVSEAPDPPHQRVRTPAHPQCYNPAYSYTVKLQLYTASCPEISPYVSIRGGYTGSIDVRSVQNNLSALWSGNGNRGCLRSWVNLQLIPHPHL